MNIKAVIRKDLKSEYRTKYAISSLFLFVFITVALIYFIAGGKEIDTTLLSGLYWIVIFFSAMTGLGRTFVAEEEKSTTLFLKLYSDPLSVYFGKLTFNLILISLVNLITLLLFLLLIDSFVIYNHGVFFANLFLTGIAIGSGTTLLSALISKANNKSTLLPILSFPVLLPILIISTELLASTLHPEKMPNANDLIIITSYTGALITASYLLFDFVWKD